MNDDTRHDAAANDPELTRLYEQSATEEPTPALDALIRAAARREVVSGPRRASSPFSRSWMVPTSLVAVLALGVGLVGVMREYAPPHDDLTVSTAPPALPAETTEAAKKESLDERAGFVSGIADVLPAAGNSPPARFESKLSAGSATRERLEPKQQNAGPAATLSMESQPAPVATPDRDDEDQTARAQLRRLVRLLDAGRDEEAVATWKRLREQHPDFPVDEKIRKRIQVLADTMERR